jgi:hypothetical protein
MKIYNYIKLDIDTWEVIEENSYEYDGVISECQFSSSSSSISSSSSSGFTCPPFFGRECKAWPCNINDTTNEIMIADWCISSSSSSSSISSSSESSSSSSLSSSSISSSSESSS